MKLSVVIPVFRGKTILPILFTKITDTLTGKYDFEVLFICDGCDAVSKENVKLLKAENQDIIRTFFLNRNYGQHRALQYGLGKATGDIIVTLDEDLQNDPADIIKFIKIQEKGRYDVVYGKFEELHHKGIRNKISVMLRKVLKSFIPDLCENYSPYRLIKREIASKISNAVGPYIFIDDLISRITKNIGFVVIQHHPRLNGESSYNFLKLLKHSLLIVLTYSGLLNWSFVGGALFLAGGILILTLRTFLSLPDFLLNVNHKILIFIGLIFIVAGITGILVKYLNRKINLKPVQSIL